MNKKFFENFSVASLSSVLPDSVRDVERLVEDTICLLEEEIDSVIHRSLSEHTYKSLIGLVDQVSGYAAYIASRLHFITMVYQEEAVRNAAQEGALRISAALVDVVSANKVLYSLIRLYADEYAAKEGLTKEEDRLLREMLRDFERGGLGLPAEELEHIKELKKELQRLTFDFELHINKDVKNFICTADELSGLDNQFISALSLNEEGKFIVRLDMASYSRIREFCTNAKTREACWELYVNRAYPENHETLLQIITLRFELARCLGFTSYAHLNTDDQMAKKPETVENFLQELCQYGRPAMEKEFVLWTEQLPEGAVLMNGKVFPWDTSYISESYKKRVLLIDQQAIKTYFPVQRTLDEMLSLYEQFLGVEFRQEAVAGLWHDSVRYVGVYRNEILLGHLFLDLYPRDFKYTHACQIGLSPALLDDEGAIIPAIVCVIANFPAPLVHGDPALLSFDEVKTFFHEFGHAMHSILGATHSVSFSGTNVPTDFVEVPSQMFEEWLHEPEVLRRLSYHYQTGEPLPDETIQKLCSLRSYGMGHFIQRQASLAGLALRLFGEDPRVAIDELDRFLHQKYLSSVFFDARNHFISSFGHLAGYGALYYSYLWSKVYAIILFAHIKRMGLFDPETGRRCVEMILSRGGTVNPQEMLRDFCGEDPKVEQFFAELGFIEA